MIIRSLHPINLSQPEMLAKRIIVIATIFIFRIDINNRVTVAKIKRFFPACGGVRMTMKKWGLSHLNKSYE
jgi:hypothetical protein